MNARWLMPFAMVIAGLAGAAGDPAGDAHFHERVRPLLESRCVNCHGADLVKGGLRLDSREATLRGGDTGPALVPGQPDASLLLQAVRHTRKDLAMPPKERLASNEVAVLERWIRDGAPWPASAGTLAALPGTNGPVVHLGDAWSDPRNPIARLWAGQRLDLWSLRAPVAHQPPLPIDTRWGRDPIDAFILASLTAAGGSPAPEANRRTLARRVFFDLIGRPPTPERVDQFVNDPRPDAYEQLVEELLADPRYGEHQARWWLDTVRYSDSNGFDWDEFRPRAWRFRDYVIRSFNADKPFDRFVREQLAGDELLSGPPRDAAEQDALIATGYLRMGPQDNSSASFNEQARSRAELMADLVETTGAAFLGLTFSCCRCHDHKFDPLSHADHFRLRAFFEGVKPADDQPLDLAGEQAAIRAHNEAIDARVQPVQTERDDLLKGVRRRLRAERVAKLAEPDRALLGVATNQVPADQRARREELGRRVEPSDKEVKAGLTKEERQRQEALTSRIDAASRERRVFQQGLLMTDATGAPAVTRVLFQGDYRSPRQAVPPGFISALDPNPAPVRPGANPKTTGRRLTLADWIVAPTNPFTARVLVNRVWQGHFGRGLVPTPNDFGLAGARPTHPALLDWLAVDLVAHGWSIKHLHRRIVLSATYRQASHGGDARLASTDGENRLYWRQNLRRLSAEQLRDNLLATAGLLRAKTGGSPVWPELPPEILQANPAFLDDNAEKTKGWYPSPAAEQFVPSIFLVQKRTVRVPFLETFDLPENSTPCPRRQESIVAPQALSLLNSTLSVAASEALAARVERDAGADPGSQVDRAFALALQRDPDAAERAACVGLVRSRSLRELCRALLNLNEFVYVD